MEFFFQTTLFFFGLVAGYFLGYILAANFTSLTDDNIIGLSAGIAVVGINKVLFKIQFKLLCFKVSGTDIHKL